MHFGSIDERKARPTGRNKGFAVCEGFVVTCKTLCIGLQPVSARLISVDVDDRDLNDQQQRKMVHSIKGARKASFIVLDGFEGVLIVFVVVGPPPWQSQTLRGSISGLPFYRMAMTGRLRTRR